MPEPADKCSVLVRSRLKREPVTGLTTNDVTAGRFDDRPQQALVRLSFGAERFALYPPAVVKRADQYIDVILRNPRTASAFSWNSKERQLSLILSEQRQSSCRYRGHACSK